MPVTLFNYLLIANIFLSSYVFFRSPFTFYVGYIPMLIFLLVYVFSQRKLRVNGAFIYVLALVSGISFFNVMAGNNSSFSFLKQFLGFIFNGIVYYWLVKVNKDNIDKLFRLYLKFAFIIAVIGILQEIFFVCNFYGWGFARSIPLFAGDQTVYGLSKVSSILIEPSHFAAALAPAMFISVLNIVKDESNFIGRPASFLIILSYLLSFSLVAYVGLVIAVFLIMFNSLRIKMIAVCTVVLAVFAFAVYRYNPEIRLRVDDTFAVASGRAKIGQGNLSTFAFTSNAAVAFKSFRNNPLFGSGLGSHPVSYDKYIPEIIDIDKIPSVLCKEDAGSLFFRLMSETGLFGILLFIYFIVKFYVPRKTDNHFWMISNSILCLFAMNLIRMGNYFYNGFIFFVWAYYFAKKSCVDQQDNEKGQSE